MGLFNRANTGCSKNLKEILLAVPFSVVDRQPFGADVANFVRRLLIMNCIYKIKHGTFSKIKNCA